MDGDFATFDWLVLVLISGDGTVLFTELEISSSRLVFFGICPLSFVEREELV